MEEAEGTHQHFQGMYFSLVSCCWMDLGESDPGGWAGTDGNGLSVASANSQVFNFA